MRNSVQAIWGRYQRLFRFCVVGGSGVGVNAAVFELSLRLFGRSGTSIHKEMSGAVFLLPGESALHVAALAGFLVSLSSNFLLNNFWTWGDRKDDATLDGKRRFLAYSTVAGVALLLQLAVLQWSAAFLAPRYANLLGIGCGTIVNFTGNHFWTFRGHGNE